jgi:hypothetical protein
MRSFDIRAVTLTVHPALLLWTLSFVAAAQEVMEVPFTFTIQIRCLIARNAVSMNVMEVQAVVSTSMEHRFVAFCFME